MNSFLEDSRYSITIKLLVNPASHEGVYTWDFLISECWNRYTGSPPPPGCQQIFFFSTKKLASLDDF